MAPGRIGPERRFASGGPKRSVGPAAKRSLRGGHAEVGELCSAGRGRAFVVIRADLWTKRFSKGTAELVGRSRAASECRRGAGLLRPLRVSDTLAPASQSRAQKTAPCMENASGGSVPQPGPVAPLAKASRIVSASLVTSKGFDTK